MTSVRLCAQIPAQFPRTQPGNYPDGYSDAAPNPYRTCTDGGPGIDCSRVAGRGGATYSQSSADSWEAPRPFDTAQREQQIQSGRGGAPPAYYERVPATEFERYVARSTGRMLPIFGASLFERVPATFAPLDQSPASVDYVIAAGDELQISVWGQVNFSRRLTVERTGEVTLPDVGPVQLAGANYTDAARVVKAALMRAYKNFDVTVSLGRLHSIQIFVLGEARRPGSYSVSSMSTLVNALFASGGPSSRGSMRDIQLRRGNRLVKHFDLYELMTRGDKSNDAQLSPGDVLFLPAAGSRVAVSGSVAHPAIYEFKEKTTLQEALRLADGLSPMAAMQEALIERVVEGPALSVLRVPLNGEGLSTELRNGDIVRVLPLVPKFERTVTLRGNVADAGRVPWHEGMRLAEVIPDKSSLLTRDYWRERNGLVASSELTANEDLQSVTGSDSDQGDRGLLASLDTSPRISAVPAAGTGSRLRTGASGADGVVNGAKTDNSLGAAIAENDNAPVLREFEPHNRVQPFAPDINWEYALIERLDKATLTTRLIPFSPRKLFLLHEANENLELEPGDVITIFSEADFSIPRAQQAKQVRLEGEVSMAGVYTVYPGETLRQVVTRAGGLTANAYLYGAQFTRESTRREQQKRYDDFLNQFEREVNESAANLSSRITSAQQAATAQTSLASQRDLVDRLRKLKLNGRIVLNLDSNSRGDAALPDLALENGDRLYVPSRPATVNVIGTVFEQASFLYEEDLRVGDYLKKAGGPARAADRGHIFVVRADGSVVARTGTNALFSKSFDALRMYPGDSVVVPTSINRASFVRNLTDWSQVFSSFALGAAAVNILH